MEQLKEFVMKYFKIIVVVLSIDVALGILCRLKIENKNPSVSDNA